MALVLLSLLAITSAVRLPSSQYHFRHHNARLASANHSFVDVTSANHNMRAEPTGSVECVRDTGGSCMFTDCHAWRGRTACSGGCICEPGLCSSASGRCAGAVNRMSAKAFTLRNARHAEEFLAIGDGYVYLTTDRNDQHRVFSLFELPVVDAKLDAGASLMTSGDGFYGFSCTIREEGCAPTALEVATSGMNRLGVLLKVAPPYEGEVPGMQSVTIEFNAMRGAHLFADGLRNVGGYMSFDAMGSVGAGMYWILDPPMPHLSAPYDGPACKWDCGSYASGNSGSSRHKTSIFVLVLLGVTFFVSVCLLPMFCLWKRCC